MADIIQIRRDTAASFIAVNPILHQGEVAFELDTGFIKIGDGITAWNSLEYSVFGRASTTSKIGLMSSSDKTKLDGIVPSQTPAADKVPQANDDGIIDPGWLDALVAREMRLLVLGINPTLDLDFARQIYRRYNAAKGLESLTDPFASLITLTRSTPATYFGPDGTLKTAAINEPRIEYDPFTGECLGFLNEDSRTNLLLGSDAPVTQSSTVAAQAYTLSFYGTGSIELSGVHSATLTGSGVFPTRSILTFTPTAGSLALTISGAVQYGQLEPGGYATSYVPTTTVAATRTADLAVISGANFSSVYNQSQWTMLMDVFSSVPVNADDGKQVIFQISDGGTLNYLQAGINKISTRPFFDCSISGVLQGSSSPLASWRGMNARMLFGFSNGTGYELAMNEVAGAIKTLSSSVPTMAILAIGNATWGTSAINGYVRRVMIFPRRLTSSQMLELTK